MSIDPGTDEVDEETILVARLGLRPDDCILTRAISYERSFGHIPSKERIQPEKGWIMTVFAILLI